MKGIIINDEIKLESGVVLSNCFCTVGRAVLKIQQQDDGAYVLVCVVSYYKDEGSYDTSLSSVKQEYVSIPDISYDNMTSANPYAVVYDYMKSKYESTTDINF